MSLFVMPREMHCDLRSLIPRPVPPLQGPGRIHAHASLMWWRETSFITIVRCGARGPDGGIKHAWVARSSENNYTHLPETERVHPTKSPPIIETSSQHTNEDTRQWMTTTERNSEHVRECVSVSFKEEWGKVCERDRQVPNRPCTCLGLESGV